MMYYVMHIIIYLGSMILYVTSYSAHCAEQNELDNKGRMLDEETQKFFVS